MKLEKIVGQNVARLRARAFPPMSQPELGRRIGEVTGKAWSRQAVSNAESGSRAFTASDLVTLAFVFEVPAAALLVIPPSVQQVDVGGTLLRRDEIEDPRWTHASTSAALAEVLASVSRVTKGLDQLIESAYPLWKESASLSAAGIVLHGQARLEERGAAIPEDYDDEPPRKAKQ